MLGFFSGVVLAVWYRNKGPQRPVYEWMEEEDSPSDKDSGDEESQGKRAAKCKATDKIDIFEHYIIFLCRRYQQYQQLIMKKS